MSGQGHWWDQASLAQGSPPQWSRGCSTPFTTSAHCWYQVTSKPLFKMAPYSLDSTTRLESSMSRCAHISFMIACPGVNAVGIRLSGCKYGWQKLYCAGGQDACAAFKLQVLVDHLASTTRGDPRQGTAYDIVTVLKSDSARWRMTRSPLTPDGATYPNRSLWDGVRYNQTLDTGTTWSLPGHDASGWAPALPIMPPIEPAAVELHSMPQITPSTRTGGVHPVNITSPAPGVFVADFGTNMAGFVTVRPPLSPLGQAHTMVRLLTMGLGIGDLGLVSLPRHVACCVYRCRNVAGVEATEPLCIRVCVCVGGSGAAADTQPCGRRYGGVRCHVHARAAARRSAQRNDGARCEPVRHQPHRSFGLLPLRQQSKITTSLPPFQNGTKIQNKAV